MFCSVGDDGNDNEGDPFLVDRRVLYEAIDALNEILGGNVGDNRDGDQKDQGSGGTHAGILDVVGGGSTRVGLDGRDALDVLHGQGEDVGGVRLNRFIGGLEIRPRAGTRPGGPRRGRGGRRAWDNVDEEMVVRVELEEEVRDVNEDEDDRGTAAELEKIRRLETAIDSAVQPFMLGER